METLPAPLEPAPEGGLCHLVGGGPGDPALLTRRAAGLLASAEVVCVLDGVAPALVAEVGGALETGSDATLVERALFAARAGRSVVVLLPGEALLLGRGAPFVAACRAAGVPFEIVPGISSLDALAAFAGMPLAAAEESVALLAVPLSGEGASTSVREARVACVALPASDASGPVEAAPSRLDALVAELARKAGLSDASPAALVSGAGTSAQRTVAGPLRSLVAAGAALPARGTSLLVAGQAVAAAAELAWFESRPLFGRRVLVTRPRHQAAPTCRHLRSRGAEPLPFPTIAIEPIRDDRGVDRAIDALADGAYGLVAFTSDNGVRCFFDALARKGRDARAFGAATVAAIGPATASALGERGIRADVVAATFVAESLAEAILARSFRPARALLPRAAVAREVLPETLVAAGIAVDVVPVYRTTLPSGERPAELRALLSGIDAILLTSSSTVEHLVELLGAEACALLRSVALASIGPVTTRTAEGLGLTVAVTAEISTSAGLVDALERYYASGAAR